MPNAIKTSDLGHEELYLALKEEALLKARTREEIFELITGVIEQDPRIAKLYDISTDKTAVVQYVRNKIIDLVISQFPQYFDLESFNEVVPVSMRHEFSYVFHRLHPDKRSEVAKRISAYLKNREKEYFESLQIPNKEFLTWLIEQEVHFNALLYEIHRAYEIIHENRETYHPNRKYEISIFHDGRFIKLNPDIVLEKNSDDKNQSLDIPNGIHAVEFKKSKGWKTISNSMILKKTLEQLDKYQEAVKQGKISSATLETSGIPHHDFLDVLIKEPNRFRDIEIICNLLLPSGKSYRFVLKPIQSQNKKGLVFDPSIGFYSEKISDNEVNEFNRYMLEMHPKWLGKLRIHYGISVDDEKQLDIYKNELHEVLRGENTDDVGGSQLKRIKYLKARIREYKHKRTKIYREVRGLDRVVINALKNRSVQDILNCGTKNPIDLWINLVERFGSPTGSNFYGVLRRKPRKTPPKIPSEDYYQLPKKHSKVRKKT